MNKNQNAIQLLTEIMQKREWYLGKLEKSKALAVKSNMGQGFVSYKKAVEVLEILGWAKVQEETWELDIFKILKPK